MPATVRIVEARSEHATVLTAIATSAKRHWGYPESWISRWKDLLTITPNFITNHPTYVAVEPDEPVGFYALEQQAGNLNLEHLWVKPDCMGRGVGRALFAHALERAGELGFSELQIEADPNAEAFYQHLGARRIGVRATDMEGQIRELPLLVRELAPDDTK